MSFGFGVGDFIAVGKLSIHLWRSIKDAFGEFVEISRELSSINIVIADLTDQAGSPTSLLNRRGSSRKEELFALRDNLMGTLEELQAVHQKYRNMGRNAWLKVQLGEEGLMALRSSLSLHLGLINAYMDSLTMASVGRMEPMMAEVLKILKNIARGHGNGPGSLLGTQVPDADDDGWEAVERQLQFEGIPVEFVRSHMDDIKTLVVEAISDEALDSVDDIGPGDSVSQVEQQTERPFVSSSSGNASPRHKESVDGHRNTSPSSETCVTRRLDHLLGGISKEDIDTAKIRMRNLGYDIKRISQRSSQYQAHPQWFLSRRLRRSNLSLYRTRWESLTLWWEMTIVLPLNTRKTLQSIRKILKPAKLLSLKSRIKRKIFNIMAESFSVRLLRVATILLSGLYYSKEWTLIHIKYLTTIICTKS
ncbi:hypothetical protein BKA64DRAFT_658149 [Cadophora sp. MPI-SDFR-AT-0126]|nr:hypothetical protein BKA64DRAFT_658149 [Leotiomycetes sp. MPI-SDFR-AT-0126]